MEEWINLISNKKLINIKLEDNLSNKYNKLTKMKYIISFDVEFLRYSINNSQIQTIHELGGLLFEKKSRICARKYLHFLPPFHLPEYLHRHCGIVQHVEASLD